MANHEHPNGGNANSLAFWLAIGAGVGAALGAAVGVAAGPLGALGIFTGFGTAGGIMLVAAIAVILRHRS